MLYQITDGSVSLGGQLILSHIDFEIKGNERIAVVGPNGSGKTTLVSLLLRFYDADSGHVRIDGRDIRSIPRTELYSMFGSALQTDFLMSDTVYEKIVDGSLHLCPINRKKDFFIINLDIQFHLFFFKIGVEICDTATYKFAKIFCSFL